MLVRLWLVKLMAASILMSGMVMAETQNSERQVRQALYKAVRFFRTKVAIKGSYLWRYSADLAKRWGEEEATATQGWVQPPGTPAVGLAFLRSYQGTGDRFYLEAAIETAHALVETQLASGGWDYRLEFDPKKRQQWFYRSALEAGERRGARRNISVYDDDNTQSALRFLMRVDVLIRGSDKEIRKAVDYGLAKLLEAQYPNGAWGQIYDGNPPDPKQFPILRASYPKNWSRMHPGKGYDYRRFYTLNDNVMHDIISTLLEAYEFYGKQRYLDAAKKGGEFLILAQMPDPQPAWAQQYDFQMQPAWARRFEPPAITAGESVGAVRALMELFLVTGDERYWPPIPKAIAWLQRSRLPDGQWARFYELQTNRPLYFNRRYELVYTDDNLPQYYGFKGGFGVVSLVREVERLQREGREKFLAQRQRSPQASELRERLKKLEPEVRRILAAQDVEGRWVEDGEIRSRTFIRHVDTLVDYLITLQALKR